MSSYFSDKEYEIAAGGHLIMLAFAASHMQHFLVKHHKAQGTHICTECGRVIDKGNVYVRVVMADHAAIRLGIRYAGKLCMECEIGLFNALRRKESMIPEQVAILIELLAHFDWYYEMSDDHRVWREGNAAKSRVLVKLEELDKNELEIFKTWWQQNMGDNSAGFKDWLTIAIDHKLDTLN